MNTPFTEIKKKLGFGCMRLPMIEGKVDNATFCQMIDTFMENGFNYFDTAHGYLDGASEIAIRECLTSRYPRESYVLTNKLTGSFFKSEEEIRPFFNMQLEACGVEYFDFYLMHTQNASLFKKFKACRAYETAFELKKEGKVRHVGISFHDSADVLDEILTAYPEIEVVQIQFNYYDYEDKNVQSRACYDVCRKHGKPILVMEPVKGGTLVNLPEDAKAPILALNGGSLASYAIRFAAGFEGMVCVLSGMGNMDMMLDNISYMKDFKPLSEAEHKALREAVDIIHQKDFISCTGCRYCVPGCPMGILIPDVFNCLNDKKLFNSWQGEYFYNCVYTKKGGKASDCIGCGACEESCPQHLPIRELLIKVKEEFEDKEDNE